jgi:integrase
MGQTEGGRIVSDNLYKRGGIWWGRVQVARSEHRRSLRTRDRVEARRRLDRWKSEITASVHFGETRLSWPAAVLRYASEVMPGSVKPNTAKRYLVSFRQIDAHLAPHYVDQISRKVLSEFIGGRRQEAVTNSTINRDLTAISAVLGACVEWGILERNVVLDIERRRVTKERREPITPPTDEDLLRVVRRAPGEFSTMIRFLAMTGCRQEEAAALEWGQVDLRAGEIMLTKTKTSRPRRIRIDAETVALLAAAPRTLATKHVFWHGDGQRYANVSSRFRVMVKSAQASAQSEGQDFRPFRCHDLRHRYAIRALESGRDIYELSRHLGHASVKTTEIYLAYINTESARLSAQVQRLAAASPPLKGDADVA